MELVERLKAQGKAILFISHKFDEIFPIADRYTVFRDGQLVGSGRKEDVTENDLVTMMVGRAVDQIFPKRDVTQGEPVLTVSGYSHPTEFVDINFTLRQGEILGILQPCRCWAQRVQFAAPSGAGVMSDATGTTRIIPDRLTSRAERTLKCWETLMVVIAVAVFIANSFVSPYFLNPWNL